MMKTFRVVVFLLLVVWPSGCAAAPRVSTESERMFASRMLSAVDLVLTGLAAAGVLEPGELAGASAQIGELRQLVDQSATIPMDWADVALRVTTLSLRWIPPAKHNQMVAARL